MSVKLSRSALFLFENLKEKKKRLRKSDEGFWFQDKLLTNQRFLLANIQELIDKKMIDFKTKNGIFGSKGDLIISNQGYELEDEIKKEGA